MVVFLASQPATSNWKTRARMASSYEGNVNKLLLGYGENYNIVVVVDVASCGAVADGWPRSSSSPVRS
jgi:hypothetical protein